MAQDQFTQNTDSPSFYCNEPYVSPELSRLSSSSSLLFSSATCWDELKSDFEQDHHHGVHNDNNCMDFMKNITWEDDDDGGVGFDVFNYENTSDFNTNCFFQNMDLENNTIDVTDYRNDDSEFHQHKDKQVIVVADDDPPQQQPEQSVATEIKRKGSKDTAAVFLEWLKANKGLISAEDLRKVKLKRSTIESHIERFGGGKQGMKRLLKLILEWVQKHHMPHEVNKRTKSLREPSSSSQHIRPNPLPSPKFTAQNGTNGQHGTDFIVRSSSLSLQRPPHIVLPYAGGSTTIADGTAGFSSLVGNTNNSVIDFSNPYQPPAGDYPWSPSQFATPSPSRDARRTRMAKQKRVLPNHNENNQIDHHHHAAPNRSISNIEECYTSTSPAAAAATAREECEDIPAANNQFYYWS